jgi:hypothetical protein
MSMLKYIQRSMRLFIFSLATGLAWPIAAMAQELIVEANVSPYVSVSSYSPRVNIGNVSTGDFSGTFTFAVQANKDAISLQLLATDLYLNSDPSAPGIKPIEVNRGAGVDIQAAQAKPIPPSTWNAKFSSNEPLNKPEGEYTAYKTDQIQLKSAQNGVFDQDVDFRVTWTQNDTIKPAGRYGGYLVLYVSLVE